MPIINCWSGPRSLSTCFLYSFAQRSDCTALDEPLYSHYLATFPEIFRPYREELLSSSIVDGNDAVRDIYSRQTAEKPLVFAKHIGKFLVGNLDIRPFYSENSLHVILIRNPLDMIMSWSDKADVHHEDCSLEGTSLPMLLKLFSDVRRNSKQAPVVVDVNILQSNPEAVLTELCRRLGIPYTAAHLAWEAGPKHGLDGLWAPYWYGEVHKSTGFSRVKSEERSESIAKLTPEQLEVYRECIPFYESLRRHAIGVSSMNPGSSSITPALPRDLCPDPGSFSQFTDPRNANILVWVGDKLVPREYAKVSVFDSAVQGGDAVWEGLRVYNGKIFSLASHLRRLRDSSKALCFEGMPDEAFIRRAIRLTLSANGMHDGVHIRLTLTRGPKISSSMNPKFNIFGTNLIVLSEWKSICGPTTYDNTSGISLVTSATRRNSPQCIDSKIHHCNLINNIMAKIDANAAGAADAVMLDTDGFVAETNATNLFLAKQGVIYTPSADYCLPGCTREIIIQLGREIGFTVIEKRVSITEFYSADEVFTTGTMGEITPVISIDGRKIVGPFIIIQSLQNALNEKTSSCSEII